MNDIGTFLEWLRKAIGLKREDFVNDIIDLRHYQRFVNGESTPYLDDFIKIITNTNLSINDVMNIFLDDVVLERKMTTKLYNTAIRAEFKIFQEIKASINIGGIMEKKNMLLYEYSLLIHDHKKKIIHDIHYITSLKKLINYPEILNNQLLSLYELMILGDILYYVPDSEQKSIVNKISTSFDDLINQINDLERNDKLLHLMGKISNYLGSKGDYSGSIKICNQGIELSLKYEEFYLLDYFYYYLALGYHNLNKLDQRNQSVVDCYLVLLSKKNHVLTNKFLSWFENDFDITDIKSLVRDIINS